MNAPADASTMSGGDELARIELEGRALELEGLAPDVGLPAGEGAAPAPVVSEQQAALWAMIPQTLGAVLVMAMPELATVYGADACLAWGRAMVPVARKYGWDVDGNSPELALLAASAPFIVGTGMAMMRRRAAGAGAGAARPGAPGQPAPAGARNSIADQAGAVLHTGQGVPPQMNAAP